MTKIPLLVALAWVGLATGQLLVALWVSQRRTFQKLHPRQDIIGWDAPSISVVIPARNEAANIGQCLTGLRSQSYPTPQLKIVVVDDNSTDDTAAIVRGIIDSDPRVQLIKAGSLPDGWIGKSHACWQGAMATQSEWLCFVDADTVAAPALLSSAVSFSQTTGIDLFSLIPFMELKSFWERVLLPICTLGYETTMGLRRVNHPATPQAAAVGPFILIRRQAYDSVQGHSAIRAEMLEDIELACRVKRAGYCVCLMRGGDLIRARMYTNLRGIWTGLVKNIVYIKIPTAVLISIIFLFLAWMPIGLLAWLWLNAINQPGGLNIFVLGLGFLASIEVMMANVRMMTPFRVSPWYGLLLPLGSTIGAAMLLHGAWLLATGHIKWKGREYNLLKNVGK